MYLQVYRMHKLSTILFTATFLITLTFESALIMYLANDVAMLMLCA